MKSKHCFIYLSFDKIYTLHGIVDEGYNIIHFIDNVKYNPIIKKIDFINKNLEVSDFIFNEFISDRDAKYYTNAKYNTNMFKLLTCKLSQTTLNSVETLSDKELEENYSKLIDYIAGENIIFSNKFYKRKVISSLETEDISNEIIAYLYFLKYAKSYYISTSMYGTYYDPEIAEFERMEREKESNPFSWYSSDQAAFDSIFRY